MATFEQAVLARIEQLDPHLHGRAIAEVRADALARELERLQAETKQETADEDPDDVR